MVESFMFGPDPQLKVGGSYGDFGQNTCIYSPIVGQNINVMRESAKNMRQCLDYCYKRKIVHQNVLKIIS